MTDAGATGDPGPLTGVRSVMSVPSTRLGWWAVWLAAAFVVLMGVNQLVFMQLAEQVAWRQTLLPFYGIGMMACGLAAGVVAAIAVVRTGERSLLVLLTLLPGLFVLLFILGEVFLPH